MDFDANTSLFAVYDGHGGAEVATYCSQNLPKFIQNTDTYKRGELIQALEDAFLNFDATIATKEVMDVLKELAGMAAYSHTFLMQLWLVKCDKLVTTTLWLRFIK